MTGHGNIVSVDIHFMRIAWIVGFARTIRALCVEDFVNTGCLIKSTESSIKSLSLESASDSLDRDSVHIVTEEASVSLSYDESLSLGRLIFP